MHSGCMFFFDSVGLGEYEDLLAEKQLGKVEGKKKKIKIRCWIEK